jgi:hypothetical protein
MNALIASSKLNGWRESGFVFGIDYPLMASLVAGADRGTTRRLTRGFGIIPDTNSDNITPQETTKKDSPDMGLGGTRLSCPGSSVVADSDSEKQQNV